MDNTLTYALERSYFDRALAQERGIRIPFDDYGDARALQLRLHKARQQDRRANLEIYEPGERLYGHSIYDGLICRVKRADDRVWVYIEHSTAGEPEVLSVVSDGPQYEPTLVEIPRRKL